MNHAAMTWIVPAAIAVIGVLGSFLVVWGAFRYKISRLEKDVADNKQELKELEKHSKSRIYGPDGTTIFMPRTDCDRYHRTPEGVIHGKIDALTAEVKAMRGMDNTLSEVKIRLAQIEKNYAERDEKILEALNRIAVTPDTGRLQTGAV